MTTQKKSKAPLSLRVEAISVDEELYPRVAGIDWDTVQHYSENLLDLPAIDVYEGEKGKFVVIDGRHRLEAHRLAGAKTIKAHILAIKREAALVLAIEKNIAHGKQLTKADRMDLANKLHAQGKSNKAIGQMLKIDATTVADYIRLVTDTQQAKSRKIITTKVAEGASIREIAAEPDMTLSQATIARLAKKVKTGEDIITLKKEPAKKYTPQEEVGCLDYIPPEDEPNAPQLGCSSCLNLETVNRQPSIVLTCRKAHSMYLDMDVMAELFPANPQD